MSRNISECPDRPIIKKFPNELEKTEFIINVVTPLFGGGVAVGENDPITLIRGSAIRGQLRFWWRATRGTGCKNVPELKEKEDLIWGTSKRPSRVSIKIETIDKGISVLCNQKVPNSKTSALTEKIPSYVIFPYINKESSNKQEPCKKTTYGIKFILTIITPKEHIADIQAAVWAWTNFGGIGARTRKGCGSLYCEKTAPSACTDVNGLAAWYRNKLSEYSIKPVENSMDWPTIPGKFLVKYERNDFIQAWVWAVTRWQNFRQGIQINQNFGRRGCGRLKWPEADSIRRLIVSDDPHHVKSQKVGESFFPRAELGMPINFRFKGRKDPSESILVPSDKNRMASPVILKALALSQTEAVSVIFNLVTPPVQEVQLKEADNKEKIFGHFKEDRIRNIRLCNYVNSPLHNRTTTGSAMEAFLSYAAEGGYQWPKS